MKDGTPRWTLRARAASALLLTLAALPAAAQAPAPAAAPDARGLRAGFARTDVTPPHGYGLIGYGPEGRAATGHRTPLFARALVLESGEGERLAFVVVDLGMVSKHLHEHAAAAVFTRTGIPADRLILSATHTHAGPGHFFGGQTYDFLGSAVTRGNAPELVALLADGIAEAVARADGEKRPARAAWGAAPVWGLTRLRSYVEDPHRWRSHHAPPPGLPDPAAHVDPAWTMLRVDLLDHDGVYRPGGALSIFAIHSTVIPAPNEEYDADVHGATNRLLEGRMAEALASQGSRLPPPVHLMANSAQGDVSPAYDPAARCPAPTMGRVRQPSGPRTLPRRDGWIPAPAPVLEACQDLAARENDRLAAALAGHAWALFLTLDDGADDLEIRSVAQTVPLSDAARTALCEPRMGTPTLAGAEDGWTRLRDWKLLGVFEVGFGNRRSVRPSTACQSPKHVVAPAIQGLVRPLRLMPLHAPVTVARVGPVLLATLPGEATTAVGADIRCAMAEAGMPGGARMHPDSVALIGLANGYLSYVTSRREYQRQFYEGSSTLYGPATAETLKRAVVAGAHWLQPDAAGPPREGAAHCADVGSR